MLLAQNESANGHIQLWPFQEKVIETVRKAMLYGHRSVMLCSPTGSGKTEMAMEIMSQAKEKGSRCLFLVDRIVLARQTSERLWNNHIQHGVFQGDATFGRNEKIQVCSMQTLESRKRWPPADFIVVDEAHAQRKQITDYLQNTDAYVIGLSATPLTEGLGATYSEVINVCTTNYLLENINPITGKPYLAPIQAYCGVEANMLGATVNKGGEWSATEAGKRGTKIIGNVVANYVQKTKEHFGGPVKTLVFSSDVAHGEALTKAFQDAGFDFRQSTYKDSPERTDRMVRQFKRGEFIGLVSVDKFTKGFDDPGVKCLVFARPYRSSLATFLQALGRGMRAAEGKEYCLAIDHSGNIPGWYTEMHQFFSNGCEVLDDGLGKYQKQIRKEGEERDATVCNGCGYVFEQGMTHCPSCGRDRPKRQPRTRPQQVSGVMTQWQVGGLPEWAQNRDWVLQRMYEVCYVIKKGDADAAEKNAKWYYNLLYHTWPARGSFVRPNLPADHESVRLTLNPHVEGKMTQLRIAFAKSKRKEK